MAELTVDTRHDARRALPLQAAWGVLDERELLRVRLDFGDGDFGVGEAAPLEPYDGVPLAAVVAALDAYAAVLARASPRSTHAELLAACAAERAAAAGAGGDRPRAVGPRRAAATGFPVGAADRGGRGALGRGQRDDRRRRPGERRPRRPPRPPRPGSAA